MPISSSFYLKNGNILNLIFTEKTSSKHRLNFFPTKLAFINHYMYSIYLHCVKDLCIRSVLWSVLSRIWKFSPNVGKYRPEKIQIQTLWNASIMVE